MTNICEQCFGNTQYFWDVYFPPIVKTARVCTSCGPMLVNKGWKCRTTILGSHNVGGLVAFKTPKFKVGDPVIYLSKIPGRRIAGKILSVECNKLPIKYSFGWDTADGNRGYLIDTEDQFETLSNYNAKSKKCECGKDKHGFASHSRWCELYEKN